MKSQRCPVGHEDVDSGERRYDLLGPAELAELDSRIRAVLRSRFIEIEAHEVHLAGAHLLGDADGPVAVGETSEVEHRGFRTGLGGQNNRALEPPGPFADSIRIITVCVDERYRSTGARIDLRLHVSVEIGHDDIRQDPGGEKTTYGGARCDQGADGTRTGQIVLEA